jgi:Leucine-rich repeat (LRR) protein
VLCQANEIPPALCSQAAVHLDRGSGTLHGVDDVAIVAQLAVGRPIVELTHARQRIGGAVGVLWRAGAAVAICAHRCQLTGLPDAISSLGQLERLDVGDNRLSELPALPASLRELYVHDNQLARLPALPGLLVLDANRNQLVEVPPLAGLDFVYLAGNRLTAAPPTSGVRYLNVGDNPLGHLALADPAIRELRAETAQLHALSIERLVGLRELSLRSNQLTALPASLGALAELRVLDLRDNQLDELPEALRRLPLAKLDLRWNPLRAPPAWLDELSARGCLVYV